MALVIAGGDIVTPDRVIAGGSLVIDHGRIVAVHAHGVPPPPDATLLDAAGCLVVPGFVDVHVHGVEGHDTLDESPAVIGDIAARLPRYGVTAFCPTTVACAPDALRGVLEQVQRARASAHAGGARVLPAHLESNFINPDYRGAQPLACLRAPRGASPHAAEGAFAAGAVLETIAAFRPHVGIVTLAPELEGGLELVRTLADAGHRVSLGHSGADFATAQAAVDAGARHATHLFNRMPPIDHRAPGLAGAVLVREEVLAEVICDGYHVHPAVARIAMASKGPDAILAITDGTAGSGLPPGSTARLGGRPIHVRDQVAVLDDGTLAGSTLTMNRAFANIVRQFGRSVVDAALMCATSPARALGRPDLGRLEQGAAADVVVMDRDFRVVRTIVEGRVVFG
jgi:N-acetylglucosamine-6-phosphate deacetylase